MSTNCPFWHGPIPIGTRAQLSISTISLFHQQQYQALISCPAIRGTLCSSLISSSQFIIMLHTATSAWQNQTLWSLWGQKIQSWVWGLQAEALQVHLQCFSVSLQLPMIRPPSPTARGATCTAPELAGRGHQKSKATDKGKWLNWQQKTGFVY
jgi:hypothetical protein